MQVPSGLLTITTDDFNWRKWFPVNMSISVWCVDIGRDAKGNIALRNSLEELYSSSYFGVHPEEVALWMHAILDK